MFLSISTLLVVVSVCFGSPTGQEDPSLRVTIYPQEIVKKVGTKVSFMCTLNTNVTITTCLFDAGDGDFVPNVKGQDRSIGNKSIGECGVELLVTEKRHGTVKCKVGAGSGKLKEASAKLVVTKVPEAPELSLDSDIHKEGENVTATCKVAHGRPAPNIIWRYRYEDFNNFAKISKVDSTGTVTEELTWTVSAQDDQKVVTCEASHQTWQENKIARKTVFVQYKPRFFNEKNELIEGGNILYSKLLLGEEANIEIKLKSRPAPTAAKLTLDNKNFTEGQKTKDGKYELRPLLQKNDSYIYTLIIKNLTSDDVRLLGIFRVNNDLGESVAQLSFNAHTASDTTSKPDKPQAVASNTMTGVIIGVSVIVIISIGVLMFAKFNKKWCFAKKRSYYIKNKEGDYMKAEEEDNFL